MTYQEALEIIKDNISSESEIIKQAIILVEFAVHKQISKKPIEKEVIGVSMNGYKSKGQCPKCSSTVSQYKDKYCPNCGQALDWSDNNS